MAKASGSTHIVIPSTKSRSETLRELFGEMFTRRFNIIKNGIATSIEAYTRMQGAAVDEWRTNTAKAFIGSRMKRDGGLNLSDRV